MKSINTLGIAFAVGMSIALGSVPGAYAATYTNHSGTICKNYDDLNALRVDYFTYGTRNMGASDIYVICPLIRATTESRGATAYVDFRNVAPVAGSGTACTLYSYEWNGGFLASAASPLVAGSGVFEFALTIPIGKSGFWTDYSVLCRLPALGQGYIMGIDLVEW